MATVQRTARRELVVLAPDLERRFREQLVITDTTLQRVHTKRTQLSSLRNRFVASMTIAEACERNNMYGHAALMRREMAEIAEEIKKLEVKSLKRGKVSNYAA